MGIFGDGVLAKLNCPWCGREISVYKATHPYCKFCAKNVIPSRLAVKLQKKIKELTGFEAKPFIIRTRSGYWQKTHGAWSWYMNTVGATMVGSQWPATQIAKSSNVSVYRSDPGTIELIDET